jgi:predicted branched-subunit amino acid permease
MHLDRFSIVRAILIGAVPAGIAFMIPTLLVSFIVDEFPDLSFDPGALGSLLMVTLFVTVMGWIYAIIPTLVGTIVMSWLGVKYPRTRAWPVWGVAGALCIIIPALIIMREEFMETAPVLLGFFSAGIICALTARYFVRWDEADQNTPLCKTEADPRLLH